jgi:hypothetical protein
VLEVERLAIAIGNWHILFAIGKIKAVWWNWKANKDEGLTTLFVFFPYFFFRLRRTGLDKKSNKKVKDKRMLRRLSGQRTGEFVNVGLFSVGKGMV